MHVPLARVSVFLCRPVNHPPHLPSFVAFFCTFLLFPARQHPVTASMPKWQIRARQVAGGRRGRGRAHGGVDGTA